VSKKVSTTSIGLFMVIGAALFVCGLLLFSSSKLFTRTREVIVYFDTSLNGLNEGAPVKYRGVTIGSVKRVMVSFNQATNDYAMPVILEVQEQLLKERLGEPMDIFNEEALKARVNGGLRASLQTESLVTGVLYVEIRLNPEAPPPVFHQAQKLYPELPSEPTQIQQLFNNLARLDIKSIETNLNRLLAKLEGIAGSLNMAEINRGVTNLLGSLDRLANTPDLTNDLASIRVTLDEYRLLAKNLNSRVDPVANGLTNSLASADQALAQVQGAANNLRTLISPNSALRGDLEDIFTELRSVAQSLSSLLDFLKQHPNALITGRQTQEKKR
jgi:paraquat-inducible protein B